MAVITAVGCPMVTVSLMVHPAVSVMMTQYAPAFSPEMVSVVAPLFQRYVYGADPPPALTQAIPVESPKQSASMPVIRLLIRAG